MAKFFHMSGWCRTVIEVESTNWWISFDNGDVSSSEEAPKVETLDEIFELVDEIGANECFDPIFTSEYSRDQIREYCNGGEL